MQEATVSTLTDSAEEAEALVRMILLLGDVMALVTTSLVLSTGIVTIKKTGHWHQVVDGSS